MRVFMTGATGYVGSAVARRLADAGHHVAGAARSQATADRLTAAGHEPVPADLFDPASLRRGAAAADAVVSAGYGPPLGDLDALAAAELAAVRALVVGLAREPDVLRPLIFTSGSGVLGPTGPQPEGEDRTPRPDPVLAWRLPVEQEVLRAGRDGVGDEHLRAASAVVSIPLVHGHGGNPVVLDFLVQARRDGEARHVGAGDNHWSAVHLDDLADLYLLALDALADGTLAPGTVLQPAAEPTFSLRELAEAVAEGTGVGRTASWTVDEADAASPMPFARLYAAEMRLDASRSRELLGWAPHRPGLLDDLARGSYAGPG